jgi:hypothetical protein
MYLTIQDFENHIKLNGIPPLTKEIEDLLTSLEKSLDVESIELSILQYQQEKAHEKAVLKTQSNTNGENKYKNNYNNHYYQKNHDGKNDGKWNKNGSHSSSSKPVFHARNGRTTQQPHQPQCSSLKETGAKADEKWVKYVETMGEFKPTKIESKEGIEKTINDIRINLNKMTKKNYEVQRNKILELINHILQEEEERKIHVIDSVREGIAGASSVGDDRIFLNGIKKNEDNPLHKIAQFIFDISSSNKFFTEIYANLYEELIYTYTDIYTDILNTFIFNFKESIQTFSYCDPNTDYEKYCEFIKEGDRKKAITTFIIMLLNRGVISPSVVIDITDSFQRLIQQYIKEDGRTNEIEELGEILYILISLGNETIHSLNDERWDDIVHQICNFTTLKVKEHKSLSTRFIFKMKDLYDLL